MPPKVLPERKHTHASRVEDYILSSSDDEDSEEEIEPKRAKASYLAYSHHAVLPSGRTSNKRQTDVMDLSSDSAAEDNAMDSFWDDDRFFGPDPESGGDSDTDAEDDPFLPLDPSYEEQTLEERPLSGPREKRATDYPLLRWLEERETFLSEFLRSEARSTSVCIQCASTNPENPALYRCLDCEGVDLLCRDCMKTTHLRGGLHRKWCTTNLHFTRIALSQLGVRFQLGHAFGKVCKNPIPSHGDDFTVIDVNGIHSVKVNYCGCQTAQPQFVQLLRHQWFPATVKAPRTAATMRVLKLFDLLSCQSKCSILEFYSTLARLSDNTGTRMPKDRYTAFARMQREYAHVKALKRAGRGHSHTGANGTSAGELVVRCPACPQGIKINMTPTEQLEECKRFINRIFYCLDANYRLRRKATSSDAADPSLSDGWGVFTRDPTYKMFVYLFGKDVLQELSNCSNHDAVNKDRGKVGYAASGTGALNCARHDMKVPSGMGDLQKGERYVNMDYLVISALRHTTVLDVVMSYDISCQYSVNFFNRLDFYGSHFDVRIEGRTFKFLIPKFHLPAHKEACQTTYSLNFNEGVGRTDGEGIERGWDNINPIATSTREMGPGARRDRLDHVLNDHNWVKVTRMAQHILRKIKEAVHEAKNHSDDHDLFYGGVEQEHIDQWIAEVAAWQKDHSVKPNPYRSEQEILTEQAVRLRIAEREAEEEMEGRAYVMHKVVSASQLLVMGISIEDARRRFAEEQSALSSDATDQQRARIRNESSKLHRRIKNWIAIQELYMPHVRQLREDYHATILSLGKKGLKKFDPTKIQLLMPSSLDASVPCDDRLLELEFELREGQCANALEAVRNSLRMSSFLLFDKRRNAAGQHMQTRSIGLIATSNLRTATAAKRYSDARKALIALETRLGKTDKASKPFRELKKEDQVPLPVEILQSKKRKRAGATDANGEELEWEIETASEGRRLVSWIWKEFSGMSIKRGDCEYHDSIRTEWCRSQARKDRWLEEVDLLVEERNRILRFFKYQAGVWLERQTDKETWMLPGVLPDSLAIEGRRAYAGQQANLFREMHNHCVEAWHNIDIFVERKGVGVTLSDGLDVDNPDEEELVDVAEAMSRLKLNVSK